MATRYFIGRAAAVAQVDTATVGGTFAGETFEISINGVVIATHTESSQTADQIRDALVTAWNASTNAHATGITAAPGATGALTLTADTAGVPFVIALNTPGGSATFVRVATTAGAGPNDWSAAGNWSAGTVPVGSDTAVIANTATNIIWGLDQSAVTLAQLRIEQSFTGRIGLPESFTTNADGSGTNAAVTEYRDRYLKIGATVYNHGVPSGIGTETGSPQCRVDLGSAQSTVTVYNTAGTPFEQDVEALVVLGTHASNVINVAGGQVGTASENPGDVSTWSQINVSAPLSGLQTLNIGAACTLTAINMLGGTVTNHGANVTTLDKSGGTYTALGSAAHTTINQVAGGIVYLSDGTITTLVNSGRFDTTADPRPKTITNCEMHRGYELLVKTGQPLSVTFTNGIDLVRCGTGDGTLDIGEHVTLSLSSV